MGTDRNHIDDDTLEQLATGRQLPMEDLPRVSEHLIVCPSCRDRLADWKDYVYALRVALRSLGAEKR
jgi:anti-sigma factor RsiW